MDQFMQRTVSKRQTWQTLTELMGPFCVLNRLGDNAYQIEIPGDMDI